MMMETVPPGTILHGRYRIERVLGTGGFGHVYLALDLQTNQQYALKEYFVTGSSGQAQLQHEARVLSQLHHPNMPAFHEAFSERGHYFVVLSYIEGNDLTDLIRVTRQRNEIIPLPRILGWILAVCDAVNFLHNQSTPVIHRDIKPDNIRITPNGTAILVDLGNAKATADGARTLFFIRHQGTPGYAPQEQYPGGSGTTAQSDVYALGGTLYFALTAHEPPSVSTRNQSLQQGLPDLPSLQEHLANNPPEDSADANAGRQFRLGVTKPSKPAQRHLRHLAQLGTLPPELLDQLNRMIRRAMAMKQKDRYPTVAEFRNDLRKVLDALPVTPPPNTPRPPQRPIDPNSTQPDLPMLYETLEAAKATANQSAASQPAQTTTCPRCGAPLIKQASFCPSCGSAINSVSKGNTVNPAVAPKDVSSSRATGQGQSPAYDDSSDSTMFIKPQGQAQAQAATYNKPPAPKSEAKPINNVSAQQGNATAASTMTQVKSPQNNTAQVPPSTAAPANNTPAVSNGRSNPAKLLIIAIVIVVVVLVIMLLAIFIINQSHHGQAMYYVILSYTARIL
ncbi:MAG: protein kinase domain-containing protein [Ktedonobacteraceae bacterium]